MRIIPIKWKIEHGLRSIAQLEEAYQNLVYGYREPHQLRMSGPTFQDYAKLIDRSGLGKWTTPTYSPYRMFNAAKIKIDPRLPYGDFCFIGGCHPDYPREYNYRSRLGTSTG